MLSCGKRQGLRQKLICSLTICCHIIPEEFQDAVNIDTAILNGISGMKPGNQAFLHRSMIPLSEVDLRNPQDRGQLDMFDNECEGMCGI